jgi:hypothetical protein
MAGMALALTLAACGGAPGPDPQTAAPTGTAVVMTEPPSTPVPATAAPDSASATAGAGPVAGETNDLTLVAGRNADGTFYRGSPDAPVTLTDYSDFL